MEEPDAPLIEPTVATDAWTLTERSNGFALDIHPLPRRRQRAVATAVGLGIAAAALAVVIDIGRARGATIGFFAGALGGLAGGLIAQLKRIWKQNERLTLETHRLSHTHQGKKKEETRSLHLGAEVEVEREPTHLADGLRRLAPGARPALTLHSDGRTVGIGFGLPPTKAERLFAEIERRVAPDRRPVPGRPGAVRNLLFPVQTGGERQRRYVGQQRPPTIDTEGTLSSVTLVTSLIALLIGGAVVIARVVVGRLPGDLEITAVVLGLAGVATLAPRRGLLDRWNRRQVAAARNAETGRPTEPWTWRGRWPGGRVQRTVLYRIAHTSATYGLPVIGGGIAWAGAPASPLLIPVWIVLVALALTPMSIYLWRVAFAGTTEVRVEEMPLVPGGRADIRFALEHGASPFSWIAFRLVRTELRRYSPLLRFHRFWTTHEGIYHLPPDTPPPGPNEEVSALFDIPADAGGTDEDAFPRIRWFLEVRGVTSAGPYIEAFPVPVFDPVPDVGPVSDGSDAGWSRP